LVVKVHRSAKSYAHVLLNESLLFLSLKAFPWTLPLFWIFGLTASKIPHCNFSLIHQKRKKDANIVSISSPLGTLFMWRTHVTI
jgi:hypothetical protein